MQRGNSFNFLNTCLRPKLPTYWPPEYLQLTVKGDKDDSLAVFLKPSDSLVHVSTDCDLGLLHPLPVTYHHLQDVGVVIIILQQ